MPFTFLPHQAPVVPLKLWRPRWFSGAGLVIGSMAPDFEKFLDGGDASRFAHSLLGQFVYCLPLGLLVYWLLTRVAAAPLARFAPDLGRFHLRDYAAALAAERPHWGKVVASTLLGSASHVALDGFTHADWRVVALFPFLADRLVHVAGRSYSLTFLLQVVASVLGGAVTVALMYLIGRRRRVAGWAGVPPARLTPAPDRSRLAFDYWLAVLVFTVALSGAVAAAEVALRRPGGDLGYALVLRLPLAGFAAACLAGLLVARRENGGAACAPSPRGVPLRRAPAPPHPRPPTR